MLDLVLPLECGGCGAPSTRWCKACARELAVKADEPHLITARLDPGVPVFSLGRYAGARREAIVAVKEHGRTDLIAPLAAALQSGLAHLLKWGVIRHAPITIVPAPTRRVTARRRGGDPSPAWRGRQRPGAPTSRSYLPFACAPWSATPSACPAPIDSGTSRGGIKACKPVAGETLVVDDIVTTGATARESVRTLLTAGVRVVAVLTIANA